MDDKAIVIKDLTKNYGTFNVLKCLNLEVKKGEVYGIIGRNGAGKSTTIDCLLGIKKPTSGSITINGLDIKSKHIQIKEKLGYVASEPACYPSMKGIDFLDFYASVYKLDNVIYKERLSELLDELEFNPNDLKKYISEYSHGMKQKICLMASLIHDPELWILDEPTVGLDVMTSEAIKRIMIKKKEKGDAVVFISHNIEFVLAVSDRVGIIHDGIVAKEYDSSSFSENRQSVIEEFYTLTGVNK